MQPFKRRKLDQIQPNFTKPFRSPLRANNSNLPTQPTAENEDQSPRNRHLSKDVVQQTPTSDTPMLASSIEAIPTPTSDSDGMQKEYIALGRQLTQLRLSLDTAQQALNIQETEQNSAIPTSIAKWKQIVRDLAEELLAGAEQTRQTNGNSSSGRAERDIPFWEQEERENLSDGMKKLLELQEAEARAEAEKLGMLDVDKTDEDGEHVSAVLELAGSTDTQFRNHYPWARCYNR